MHPKNRNPHGVAAWFPFSAKALAVVIVLCRFGLLVGAVPLRVEDIARRHAPTRACSAAYLDAPIRVETVVRHSESARNPNCFSVGRNRAPSFLVLVCIAHSIAHQASACQIRLLHSPKEYGIDGQLDLVGRHRQHANRGSGNRPASPSASALGS